ncbi:MAG: acetyl-CoA synthetase [Proteobacteria bacterium]|nr:acetyl-CoA synthetase [Pseudomonadota bacterium]
MHPLIEKAKQERRHLLEPEALGLLGVYGISVPRNRFVHTEEEALSAATLIGLPIVMKVVSPDVLHKTEMSGVILPIESEEAVRKAFSRLVSMESGGANVLGVLVSPFQRHEIELSVGMIRDSQFGPVMNCGLGGIWIEILRDMAYGIAPLSLPEAEAMLRSLRGYEILTGTRGRKAADGRALCELLVSLSRMVLDEEGIQEIDLNPIFPMEKGYFIADARILLSEVV